MRKKIYILGKVSGLEKSEVVKKFEFSASVLFGKGFTPVNPLTMVYKDKRVNGIFIPKNYNDIIKECLIHLTTVDAIFLQKDYKTSKGSLFLLGVAKNIGLEIIYEENEKEDEREPYTGC